MILGLATNIGIHLIKVTLYQSYDARLFAWVFRIQLKLFDGSRGEQLRMFLSDTGDVIERFVYKDHKRWSQIDPSRKGYAQRVHAYL